MSVETNERAVDASRDKRPGVPEEHAPEPIANAHWLTPQKQTPDAAVLKDVGREELTATFGTAQPPSGASGILRKAAYRIPDYYARRWMLLILADRVDALESGVARLLKRSWPSTE